ncbi:EpsG family protein [Litchfieldia alkalitelluris]|uniref:EpsG family protein n=1 Tax=Litchfieldia alkalitelluris TaxID=304268 RepID=UPI0009974A64|nr:EpsG family protein [Litchfieldia alkalitelluris]
MTVLWLNLSCVYLFSFFSRYFTNEGKNQIEYVKPNKLLVSLVILSLVLVSGLRRNIGDTHAYMQSYKNMNFTWDNIDFKGDFGFNIFQMYLQQISTNPQTLVFVTALITNLFIIVILYKYSRVFELSCYVYITSGFYLVSMNGIRQFFAASLIFLGTKFILNGDWKKYILLVLFASTFHKSALLLIPIYFVVRRRAWTKVTILILTSAIFIVLGFNKFMNILFTLIEDTQYSQYSSFDGGGASFMRVIVNAVPLLVAYIGRGRLREIHPKSDYIVNICIVSLLFTIIATQNWIFTRFNIYLGLYNLILIGWVVNLFKMKDQKLIYFGIICCYLVFFVYEHILSLNIIYKSNYISL